MNRIATSMLVAGFASQLASGCGNKGDLRLPTVASETADQSTVSPVIESETNPSGIPDNNPDSAELIDLSDLNIKKKQ